MRVDIRAGSNDLIPLLRRRGVRDVEPATLFFGDIEITGRGPEDRPVSIGIEHKKLPDLLQCIDNGRFVGHQLPGMLDIYEVNWLLVEGIWRERPDGLIEVPRGAGWQPIRTGMGSAMAATLQGFLMTMEQKVGLKVMRTGTCMQTVDWLFHLNRWWTAKEWEEHRAHLAFDNSQAMALISRPSLLRRVAATLPGIGMGRSGPVSRKFSSVVDMALAGKEEWMGIVGIGKTTAERVVRHLNGDER